MSSSAESYALSQMLANGPPYPARNAAFGGKPDDTIDVGVSAMFIVIFACLAATHMYLFKTNKAKGHFFIFSGVTFGFCMARITTFAMRIATAKNPENTQVAMAAGIFVSAGVLLLYIVNLNFTQRIVRSYHPRFGRSKPVVIAFAVYYVSVVCVLIMLITATVIGFYTLDTARLLKCRDIQRFGIIYFTVFSFMPIPLVLAARFIRTPAKAKFGKMGTTMHKVIIVIIASLLLTLENAFRAAIAFLPPRPITNPAWYHKRAAFYVFLPTLEVIVVILYAVARVDQRMFEHGKAEREANTANTSDEEKSRSGTEL
ncbi:hypothetical protein BZA05DRAFT_441085 [Tricharina praecox]|uniref:uncharacterized protein n=1 Tax=Tricharina praecox TaxID=43433 RepID=UPI00221E5699|nr:uncharacterized protein BZA05DRAFT_441085 [Tricharina praecox]KAI5857778.1 hypothetical protein BZA05DRAFT_441085 [Tricharina praecox]